MEGGKPFLWFGSADGTLRREDLATPRARLARELLPILSYMAKCDLEKPNEPVVILFSRLPSDILRSGAVLPSRQDSPSSGPMLPGDASAAEQLRVQALRRAIGEARAKLNPRFVILVSVQQPWLWTLVFLRSHDNLRVALHRLAPAATQLVADRRGLPLPSITVLDDLTPGPDVVQRLRGRTAAELRPLLTWMGEEDMEGANERIVVLYVCTDVHVLAQRFVQCTLERSVPAAGAAPPVSPGLADLPDAELQRMLLARDRLFDVVDVVQPRVLVLVNWLRPEQWTVAVCRNHTRLVSGVNKTLPNRTFYVWAPRRIAQPTDPTVTDICYSNACPRRGEVQQGVMFCPKCLTAKYCSAACQSEHWSAGHCRLCARLQEARLRRGAGPVRTSGGAGGGNGGVGSSNARSSFNAIMGRR